MNDSRSGASRWLLAVANIIPLAMTVLAAWVHAWAGQVDEGHAVWHPGGHGSAFAALAWIFTGIVALSARLIVGRRAVLASIAGGCAAAGLVLLFGPR
jgi:hypothetical protein